ncbi:MAG TPA: VWA domain-containing protein [Pyrinomonadaceae bacterium]|nr:VWA domain-containing protein [Pyrinomonadaceae bacterium]
MRVKLIGSVALLLLAITVNHAQTVTPSPTATPPPTDDDGKVVKITTSIIQIDVSVTDRKGRAISDLKPDEIEIYENGVKQKITGFSFVSNPQAAAPKEKKVDKNDPKANIPEPPLVLRPEQVRRTIALVVDDLTLSFESTAHVRRALKRFVDTQMQDGDLVGIIRTGVGIGALQQFTSNKQQLYAAIDRVKWNASGRGRFGSFDPTEPTMTERARARGDEFITDQDIQQDKRFSQEAKEFRESVFTTGTLGALKYIVDGMGELPGRKSVILFSDGFQIFPRLMTSNGSANQSEDPGLFGSGNAGFASQTIDFMRDLVDIANRKSVIFYTIDARGLETTAITSQDQFADPTLLDRGALQSMRDVSSDRSAELFDTQQGLVYLAKQTGGLAYYNQNDIGNGIDKALDDQSYYLVAYEPGEASFDANVRKFNKLDVKVLRDDTKVRHRSGFFVAEKKEPETVRVDVNTPTKIMRALKSPFAVNDISVKLNALFGYSEKDGYYVHSFLHINTKDMQFTKLPNGDYQSVFDVLAVSYGDNGQPVDKNNVTGTMQFKPEQYAKLLDEGFSYSFIFPVKKPGAYQMRVAIFDRGNKEVGSANQFIEVPNLKKSGVTLSGIVLENITEHAWNQLISGASQIATSASSGTAKADPLQDTSLRKYRRGTVLRYGVEIYNAKIVPGQSQIRLQTRVFQDRKKVFEGEERQVDTNSQPGVKRPVFTDAVSLGKNLLPGDYVLQVIVTDGLAKEKKRLATQYVQFEVIE